MEEDGGGVTLPLPAPDIVAIIIATIKVSTSSIVGAILKRAIRDRLGNPPLPRIMDRKPLPIYIHTYMVTFIHSGFICWDIYDTLSDSPFPYHLTVVKHDIRYHSHNYSSIK